MVDFDAINDNVERERKETLKWARTMSEHSQQSLDAPARAKAYDVESALCLIGGFGKFQWVMSSIVFANLLKNGLVYYPLPYLTLMPEFDCYNHISARWEKCTPKDFCEKDTTW